MFSGKTPLCECLFFGVRIVSFYTLGISKMSKVSLISIYEFHVQKFLREIF